MLTMNQLCLVLTLGIFGTVFPASGSTFTIDFEGLADSTPISTTYSPLGATFTNALVITAGLSLNELEFPPNSGQNVATDNGGPITITLANAVSSFFAYFTYAEPLTLTAYDLANDPLVSASSAFSQNFVSSGNSPDELIALNDAAGIAYITIAGDPDGGSFVMDDATFTISGGGPAAPEPATIFLTAIGFFALVKTGRSSRDRAPNKPSMPRS